MKIIFDDIPNDESHHWNHMTSNPIIPPSQDVYDVIEDGDAGDETNNDGAAGIFCW